MVVTKWTPQTEEEEAIPMWVHVKGVPLHMYAWEGLSFVISVMGFPVKLHPETIACTNFEVAKVFVNVDVSKVLPKEIKFSKNGKEFVADFHFPWLPTRCNICDKWGHGEKVCTQKVKDKEQASPSKDTARENKEKLVTSQMEVVVNTVVEEQREEVEVEKEDNTALKEGNETVDDANNWARVSPAKVGRSPMRPDQRKYTEDFQISASKVSVLSVEDGEEGEIMEERLQVSAVEIPKTNPEKYEDEGMS